MFSCLILRVSCRDWKRLPKAAPVVRSGLWFLEMTSDGSRTDCRGLLANRRRLT